MIELRSVTKRHRDGLVAVDELSLTIASGELCVLVGPSGCGKTTTLKMINRLIEPTSGQIFIDDVDVMSLDPVQLRRGIGYVMQHGGLFPHRRIGDNVAVVPKLLGWPTWSSSALSQRSTCTDILTSSPAANVSALELRELLALTHRSC